MIINKITSKIKNIIFFKIVSLIILASFLTYYINIIIDNKNNLELKQIVAKQTLKSAQEKLDILNNQSNEINEILKIYHSLISKKDQPSECFNKASFNKSIKKIEKKFGLKSNIKVFASSSSSYRKIQSVKSILLKTTSIKLDYNTSNFLNSVKIARSAFQELPIYNFVKSYEITKNNILSPSLIEWLSTSNTADIISNNLLMEVKELDLNEY